MRSDRYGCIARNMDPRALVRKSAQRMPPIERVPMAAPTEFLCAAVRPFGGDAGRRAGRFRPCIGMRTERAATMPKHIVREYARNAGNAAQSPKPPKRCGDLGVVSRRPSFPAIRHRRTLRSTPLG